MDIHFNIKNEEDIEFINNISNNKEEILRTAMTIGLKSISMSEMKLDCNSYINPIKDIINDSISNIEDKMDMLLFSKNNASRKGKLGEKLCVNILNQYYSKWEINDVAKEGYQGDCRINTGDYEILLEFKTYETNVNEGEINKFKRDLKHTGLKYGIFVSNTSGIVGKNCIDWEIYDNSLIIYVSNMGINGYGCIIAVEILKCLININILENSNHIYYENYNIIDIKHNIISGITKLKDTNERLIKHRQMIKEDRDKVSKVFDNLEKDIFDIELELNKDLSDILTSFDNIDCTKETITDFDRESYLSNIEDPKIKTLIIKFIDLVKDKFILKTTSNNLILNNGEFILKKNKKKYELYYPIKDTRILLDISYEKIKGNDIVVELKNDMNLWDYLEKKLNV